MNMVTEKYIKNYELLYSITTDGKVYSLPKSTTKIKKIMKTTINNSGYECIILCKKGKHKTHTLHKLMMQTFVGDRPEGLDIDHIDGNKLNNEIINLRYVTRKTNMKNAVRNGYCNFGEKNSFSKLKSEEVIKIINDSRTLVLIANDYKVSQATISRIKNKLIWKSL